MSSTSNTAQPAATAPAPVIYSNSAYAPVYSSSYAYPAYYGGGIGSYQAPAYAPAPIAAPASTYSTSSSKPRDIDDLKASGEFIGPGPDYMYTEEVYEGPKRDFVESFGRDETKDEYYDRVLKERFSSILTIIPKKPVEPPAPAPAPKPAPPARPTHNRHLYIAPENETRAEGQTISAAGWYVDTDYKNVTYKWFSNGTLVGTNQSLFIASSMVGSRLKVEATHKWLDIPLHEDAYTDVPAPRELPREIPPPPPKYGPIADIALSGAKDHNVPIRAEVKWDNNPARATFQWLRSVQSQNDASHYKPIPNATNNVYLPTVDDLHGFLRLHAQQVDDNGAAVGAPFEKNVPVEFVDINKSLEKTLNDDFKRQKAGYQVYDASNNPVFINLDKNGLAAFQGTRASGNTVAVSGWTSDLTADLSYNDYKSFNLTTAQGVLPLSVAPGGSDEATSLARDKVVLAIRSFKGFHLQKSDAQLRRAQSMVEKAHGSLSRTQKLDTK